MASSSALNALLPGCMRTGIASAAAGVLGNQVCTTQHVNQNLVWSRHPPHVPAAWPDVKPRSALQRLKGGPGMFES